MITNNFFNKPWVLKKGKQRGTVKCLASLSASPPNTFFKYNLKLGNVHYRDVTVPLTYLISLYLQRQIHETVILSAFTGRTN